MANEFQGKRALIAGGASGIGADVAKRLSAQDARVMVADINGGDFRIDLADTQAVADMFAEIDAKHGGLDLLVNCTGVLWFDRDRSALEMDMDVWDDVMRINLKSFALTIRGAVPLMRNAGGGAMVTSPPSTPYAATTSRRTLTARRKRQ